MKKFGIGQPVKRREDLRFLTGRGCYTDDLSRPGQLVGMAVRAPLAHAEIGEIDTTDAEALPGVHLVLTAERLKAMGVSNEIACLAPPKDGVVHGRPVLAEGRVRHVGEAVAFIVAESREAAEAARDLVFADLEPLDTIVDTARAGDPDAPSVHEDAPANRAFVWSFGDAVKTGEAFSRAAHVTRIRIRNQRVAPNAMEPRAILAEYEEGKGFVAHLGTQGVEGILHQFATLLGEPEERIRVVTPDVGGGFGMKSFMYPEYVLAMAASRALKRPVKWTADRNESFLSDTHGRDLVSEAALAFDEEARILGYRIETIANMGAYLSNFAPAIATMAPLQVVPGPYRIPVVHQQVTGVYTHTQPIDAYRGAGRPEAAYLLERLVQRAAREMGLAPDEIRRRNFVPESAMPWTNATGATYDSGDFLGTMEAAMARADWDGFEARREQARTRGLRRGIGMAYYVECTLGAPSEEVELHFTDDGRLRLYVGTQSNGQGHETAWPQVLADRLDISPERIEIVQGDTAAKPTGGGTGGSRSLQMIGNACVVAADALIARGREVWAALEEGLEAEDVEYAAGEFFSRRSNRRIGLFELAELARSAELPEELAGGLDIAATYTRPASTFPNGCHIAEVEVDPETGVTRMVRYTVVDDFGVVINPMLVTGQVHGGVVQGIGQALGEAVAYDEDGQLLTGSFMDYVMPRADDLCRIDFHFREIPCRTNPLGIKGCGEAGTIGACPAVINAILDALWDDGVHEIDMPATPHRVWQALRDARAAGDGDRRKVA
ncbi:MAG: xanthine dehydrogenase family protein molybdopterin-binding subunit [Alphaproteobacteria bacterium]|nr:MAG: xanthine dehydrogenase family protein molybdopterin-binding subunit [Alphaproteobacteria bacterium]